MDDGLLKYLHLALEFRVGFLFQEAFLMLRDFTPQGKYRSCIAKCRYGKHWKVKPAPLPSLYVEDGISQTDV